MRGLYSGYVCQTPDPAIFWLAPWTAHPCGSSFSSSGSSPSHFTFTMGIIQESSSTGTTTITGTSGGVNAYSIQVRWESTDSAILSLLDSSNTAIPFIITSSLLITTSSLLIPTSSLLIPTSSLLIPTLSSSTSTLATTANPPPGAPPTPGGLSQSAKIGVGVGISCFFLALGSGLFYYFYRRRLRMIQSRDLQTSPLVHPSRAVVETNSNPTTRRRRTTM